MTYSTDHKAEMASLAGRMDIDAETFDHVCAVAHKLCERTFGYSWAAAGLRAHTLDRGTMWADLVSEVLIYVGEGETVTEAVSHAVKAWGSEQFQNANVTNPRTADGGRFAYVASVPTEAIAEEPAGDASEEATIDRIDAERVLQKVRATLTDEEWDLLVKYADLGSYAALGDDLGITPNGAKRRVRRVQQRVVDLGLSSLL